MTENELIGWIEAFKKTYAGFPKESEEACDAVISALKEIQKYREIGTVEECREAVERQKPKKPLVGIDDEGNGYMICRNCSDIVERECWVANYCPDCGQAIDWEESEEE